MQIIQQKTNTRLMVYSKAQKKRLISGKMNSSCEDCIKNILTRRTTCWQLLKLHFSVPKTSDFLILNWAGQAADTNGTINRLWWPNLLKFSITAILLFWRQMQITVISKLATHTCTVWLLLSWFILGIFPISYIRECWQRIFVTLSRFWLLRGWGWVNLLKKKKLWWKSFFR